MDIESFVEAADKALYTAKERGRDRLVMSEYPTSRPDAKIA
jgi:PleD family two-component response regulator